MIQAVCQHENRSKHGKDRNGNQRYKCRRCGVTFLSEDNRPLGDMRLPIDKAVMVLKMLLEGMSIRACERITGVKRDTICDLVLHVGGNCDRFLEANVKGVQAKFIEVDEIWDFVLCKQKTKEARGRTGDVGDSWTWLAIDAESKMILAHHVGQRGESDCKKFLSRVNDATVGRCQVTSDGLSTYTNNVPFTFGSRCSFAQLIKNYKSSQSETRYSPATITSIEKKPRFGNPDNAHISTSYSERLNLSVRMHVRRFTRLTNAHSKSATHHAAMVAIFVAWYNFCRKHETVKGTPAMAAGLAEQKWSINELLTNIAIS
ncbi:MAG: IS1 family transposase [Planctomycetaceae bacterium]|nr:IS1 family transposase [Planctomycetales bacterium]MCB9924691.1 IS1 family transposase [Planctomycetaceae bacterium]